MEEDMDKRCVRSGTVGWWEAPALQREAGLQRVDGPWGAEGYYSGL